MRQEEKKATMDARTAFLFESFLPYRDALQLARWVQGVLRLQRALSAGGPVSEHFCWGAGGAARRIAPQIRPAEQSKESFDELLEEERRQADLSESELEDRLEKLSESLAEKIDSGELDIWDDSPRWVDRSEVERFLDESLDYLEKKILPACNGKISFLESLIPHVLESIRAGNAAAMRGYYALLLIWDYGRMFYEGEPPYRIVFSKQVAEALGIDPEMESVRMQTMRPVEGEAARRLFRSRRIAESAHPDLIGEVESLFEVIKISPSSEAGHFLKS
jgi:hypothetical protein